MDAVRFVVDDVTPIGRPLQESSVTATLNARFGESEWIVGGPASVVSPGETHPLIAAVMSAYRWHRPLVLSPDAIWITIAQGFARHLLLHAEALRRRFVQHEGQKPLAVEVLSLGRDDWPRVIGLFRERLCAELGPGMARLLAHDFSTSGPVEQVAGDLSLMVAFERYFKYNAVLICGIPHVTLRGKSEDWRRIRARVDVLAEYDLEWWAESLRPICDQFVRAAEGRPDRAFWKRICLSNECGPGEPVGCIPGTPPHVTGWIARLFPYIGSHGDRRNPLIDAPQALRPARGPGLSPTEFPGGMSATPITVSTLDGRERTVQLRAGLLGAKEDPRTLALEPVLGWAVQTRVADLFDDLRVQFRMSPPVDDPWLKLPAGPKHLDLFYRKTDGGVLFDGAWRVRRASRLQDVDLGPSGVVTRFIDLPGDRALVFWSRDALRRIHLLDGKQLGAIVADDLADLFHKALAGGPLFFDDARLSA